MTAERPLRVAQIVTTLARGGAQATVMASADRAVMAGLGAEVTVLAGPGTGGEGGWWDDPAVARARVVTVPDLVRPIAPGRDLRALLWLVRWLRTERPDVVHTHSAKAGALGRLAAAANGTPCVHTVHGWSLLHSRQAAIRHGVATVERSLARLTTTLVVVGRADLDAGLRAGIGRPDRYRLVRSGIELPGPGAAAAARARLRPALGLDDRLVVGMVGRLSPPKDQASLIEAVARTGLPGIAVVLVGDGPQRAELERLAARSGVDVRFLGHRSDGAEVVTAFDLAVNASRYEGLPRSVVEAAAAGVPVVATDVGSTAEVIAPGRSGRLVPPGDPVALADAISDAIERSDVTATMAAEARCRAGAFDAAVMRAELVALWTEAAVGHRCDPAPGVAPARTPLRSRRVARVR